jgi:subtilisin family serine protease
MFLVLSASAGISLTSKSTDSVNAPELTWDELATSSGGYSVEFSADGFQTILYSTYSATGSALTSRHYNVPAALWKHIPAGTTLQWRVVTLDSSGEPTSTSQAGTITVGGGATAARNSATPVNFSLQSKLNAASRSDNALKDELLVLTPASREAEAQSALEATGFPVERRVTALGKVLLRFETQPGADLSATVVQGRRNLNSDLYNANGEMTRQPLSRDIIVQKNFIYHATLAPTDPYYASTPKIQYAPQQIHASDAWAANVTGSGIIIAVIDTGLNSGASVHQEFNGASKLKLGPDLVNLDTNPNDDNGHGTNVAGIAAAEADGTGMVGIAPDAMIMPIKTLNASGSGSTLDISEAIDYAVANGARVINMSLGANVYGGLPDVLDFDYVRENAMRNAEDRGVVCVCAAGNDHASLPGDPASFADAINVGAVTPEDRLTEFRNYGPFLSIVAPGYFQYSAANSSTSAYGFESGTSQATPVVAGVAALVLSKNPALTPRQVKEIIQSSADDLGATGRDDLFGFGRVNAARAVAVTPGADATPPSLANVEFATNKIVATFSHDMLADGSGNSINSGSFLGGGTNINNFIMGCTLSYDSTKHQLTLTNNSSLLTSGQAYSFGFSSSVQDTSGHKIFCNQASSAAITNYCGSSLAGLFVSQGYAQAVAYDDGSMKVQFRHPVTEASAENSANYTLYSQPTNTSGGSSPGGTVISLSSAAFSYDTTTRLLTITGVPAGPMHTIGNTFALALGSGILNSDLNNPISTSNIQPSYGRIRSATGTNPKVTAVSNFAAGFRSREVIMLTFNEPMRADDELMNPANYSVTIGGLSRATPSDCSVLYTSSKNEVELTGFDMSGDDGKALSVTVANLQADDDSTTISGTDATAAGTIDLNGDDDIGPQILSVSANPGSLFVQFTYDTKMDVSSVTTSGNWVLKSDASNPPSTVISLAGKTFSYDSEQNALTISGLSLTAGNYFSLSRGTFPDVPFKRFAVNYAISSAAITDVVGGNGDFSPVKPTAATVNAATNGPDHNNANQINLSNESNVSVDVTVPAGAVSGQKLTVTLVDSDSNVHVASSTTTLPSSGAQTVTVSGMDASSFVGGDVYVQAVLATSSGDGSSDIFRGTAIRDFSAPVSVSSFELN